VIEGVLMPRRSREKSESGFKSCHTPLYQYNNEINDCTCLDINEKVRITDEELEISLNHYVM